MPSAAELAGGATAFAGVRSVVHQFVNNCCHAVTKFLSAPSGAVFNGGGETGRAIYVTFAYVRAILSEGL